MEANEREQRQQRPFLPKDKSTSISDRPASLEDVTELTTALATALKWTCIDQSNVWRSTLSWSFFILLTFAVPIASYFLLECTDCDDDHKRPYHGVVQVSLSVFATISFLCLSRWMRKYGLGKFLFLEKLSDCSEHVHRQFADQLKRTIKLCSCFALPCFCVEAVYKLWWFISGSASIPYYGNIYVSDTVACTLELCSWLYRTSLFFLVCVLYRLVCYLQILRLEQFGQVFQKEMEVGIGWIFTEHLRIRRTLRVISHRFRAFILSTLILVTASQFISLLMVTRSGADVDIYKAGDLAICSIGLVTGLFVCLRSAAKITHKAQSLTGLAAKWHVCATINSFDEDDGPTPMSQTTSAQVFPIEADFSDEEGDGEDDLDNDKFILIYANTVSFQKRQALVMYLEKNSAGITVYGFMLDRARLHAIFAIQLALLLWLLNKTIGVS